MRYDSYTWPLRDPLVRPNLIELIRSDLKIKPAYVEFLDLLSLWLLSKTGCIVLPSIRIRLETWINLSLLEPELFWLYRNNIVDSVPSVYNQLVRLWILNLHWCLILLLFRDNNRRCLSFHNLALWRRFWELLISNGRKPRCHILKDRLGHRSIGQVHLRHGLGDLWLVSLLAVLPSSWHRCGSDKLSHLVSRAVNNGCWLLVKVIWERRSELRLGITFLSRNLRELWDKFLVLSCASGGWGVRVTINWVIEDALFLAVSDRNITLLVHYFTSIII